MEIDFLIGNSYTIEELEKEGYVKTKQTSIILFYRKGNILLTLEIPKPLEPKKYKILSICKD